MLKHVGQSVINRRDLIRGIFSSTIMGFTYIFYKHQTQRHEFFQSALIGEARSIQNDIMDISEEFSRLLELSVELNLQVIKKGSMKKNKKMKNMVKIKMTQLFQDVSTSRNAKLDDIIVLTIVYFYMGILYGDCEQIEKLQVSEAYFMTCLELLKGKECECKTIMLTIKIFIELSLIWSKLEKPEKYYFFLDQAMMLYLKYTNEENEYPDPIDPIIALGIENEVKHPKLVLEEFYAIIIENLIELYQIMPKNMHRFVIYFHNLLEKQIAEASRNEESMEWAQTSLALSIYFIQNHRFTEARNHIAAAEYILDTFCNDIQNQDFSEELHNFYKEIRAKIADYWGTYGLRLLYLSRYKLSQDEKDNTLHEIDNSKSEFCTRPEEELIKFLIFADLEKDLEKKYLTDQITDKYVSNSNDAKIIFVNVLKWFNETKKYYSNTSGNNSIESANLTMQMSYAYKYFAQYEPDKDKQLHLYKIQIKILKELFKILSANGEEIFNSNLGVSYYAQMNWELSFVNSFILNIRTEPLIFNIEQLTNDSSINQIPLEITYLANDNMKNLKKALDVFSLFV